MRTLWLAACSLALLGHVSAAQTPLLSWDGGAANDRLGSAVAGAGDIDGDGTVDLIMGAPYFQTPRGLVQVMSGSTGATLYRHKGTNFCGLTTHVGYSVDRGGDANGDGVGDYIYGSLAGNSCSSFGRALVRSGVDGSILLAIGPISSLGPLPGFDVAFLGDANNDGLDDVATSDPGGDWVAVYDSATSNELYELSSTPGVNAELGFSIDGGDYNGNGRADVLVGAPGPGFANLPGCAEIYVGQNGVFYRRITGFDPGGRFGHDVAHAGDTNGDGTADVVIGAPEAGGGDGRAYVFSTEPGTPLLLTLAGGPGDRLGTTVDGLGDVNGDGYDDVAVGAPLNDGLALDGGRVTVYSGLDGSILRTFLGSGPGDRFGAALAAAGDVDGGGLEDVIVGSPHRDTPVGADVGRAEVYVLEAAPGTYCSAKVNSQGCVPYATVTGVPSLAASTLELRVGQVINNQTGFLFWGTSPTSMPFLGGTRCVRLVAREPLQPSGGNPGPDDCSGTFSDTWTSAFLQSRGFTAGQTLFAQFWYTDPAATQQAGLSDGLQFTILP